MNRFLKFLHSLVAYEDEPKPELSLYRSNSLKTMSNPNSKPEPVYIVVDTVNARLVRGIFCILSLVIGIPILILAADFIHFYFTQQYLLPW